MSSNDQLPDRKDKFVDFDDDAIRVELRRMVEDVERRYLESLAGAKNGFEAHCEASNDVDESMKSAFVAKMEAAKSDGRRRYQKVIDFIERQ